MSDVRTTCAYCGVGCGIIATPDGSGGAVIVGDAKHPANFGRLCTKGTTLGHTLSLEDRLLNPMIGGVQATWNEATDLVAKKFKETIEEHGPDSVAFYVSGQLLTEDYYVANKLMKGFIGSANIDTNSRLCMASSVAGHKRAFGTDTVPGTYADLDEADLIVLVGSNLAWCHPVLHQRIIAAQEQRGLKIVNIDPRRTATSDMADMHLGIAPGGDVALFNGLLKYLGDAGKIDAEYIAKHVNGFADAMAAVTPYSLGHVSSLTGLTPQELEEFYCTYAKTERVVTIYSQGVNQASDGTDKVNAIINCHLATGRIGGAGQGPFSVTGQPNAMGGREVGGLANMLAAHLDIENPDHRDMVQDFWNSPTLPTQAGLKAVDMFKACASGKIKALWVMCTNPAVSMPRADDVAAAIEVVDFVVVSDIVEETDTTVLADVLLPAAGWGEKDGTVTNSERRISRQRAFLPLPEQARPDWKIICDVAKKMGWGADFSYQGPHEIFKEWASQTYLSVLAGKDLDLTALSEISVDRYEGLEPVQWPVRPDGGDTRFFENGGFFTSDAKARMLAVHAQANSAICDLKYPYILNTGRVRDHWHTLTRTAKSAVLSQHISEPFLQINAADAADIGVETADLVQVNSPYGTAVLRAQVSDRQQVGQVFAPLHWTGQFSAKGRIDVVVPDLVDPVSGQPELKRTAVGISKFHARWFGFGICLNRPSIDSYYWASSRVKNGWRIEIADSNAPESFEGYVRETLNCPQGQAVSYQDPASGQQRLVIVDRGVVIGAFFAGPSPVYAARGFVSDALGQKDYKNLLAGASGADAPDIGPVICNCFNVGVNQITNAVLSGQARDLGDIGRLLQAGTNCGSCRPEISNLIANYRPKIAAE